MQVSHICVCVCVFSPSFSFFFLLFPPVFLCSSLWALSVLVHMCTLGFQPKWLRNIAGNNHWVTVHRGPVLCSKKPPRVGALNYLPRNLASEFSPSPYEAKPPADCAAHASVNYTVHILGITTGWVLQFTVISCLLLSQCFSGGW